MAGQNMSPEMISNLHNALNPAIFRESFYFLVNFLKPVHKVGMVGCLPTLRFSVRVRRYNPALWVRKVRRFYKLLPIQLRETFSCVGDSGSSTHFPIFDLIA